MLLFVIESKILGGRREFEYTMVNHVENYSFEQMIIYYASLGVVFYLCLLASKSATY